MDSSEFFLRRRRSLLAGGVLLAVALIVAALLHDDDDEGAAAARAPALSVTARQLEAMEVNRTVTANGTVFAWQEVIVGPEVGGYRVAAVDVDVGSRVRKGQELVRMADDLLVAEVGSRRANVAQATATLDNAAAAYRRAESLSASAALSQSDVDRLRSEELAARARLEAAKADLETAQLRLRHTRVTAPDDGVIAARSVSVGQVAQVGAEMLRMLRQGRVEWRAEVPEARLREIKVGQSVDLFLADGATIAGRVRAIAPTIESATRAGLVYVDIPAAAGARPGMFARGEIQLARTAAQMTAIASVVIQDGYSFVFVLKDDLTVERRHVETGVVQGELIEIVSGIAPGERIVEKGAGFLKDGDHVNLVLEEAPVRSDGAEQPS